MNSSNIPIRIGLSCIWMILSLACASSTHRVGDDAASVDTLDFAYEVRLSHARTIAIANYPQYKGLYLLHPDTHDTIARYALFPRGTTPPEGLPLGTITIAVPVTRIACGATTHVGAIDLLGGAETIVGCNAPQNINSPRVAKRYDTGQIVEIARGMSRNVEALLSIRPDVLLDDFGDTREADLELARAGIKVMQFSSWKEQDLLSRAEWIKVAGMLLGKNRQADSLFRSIEQSYDEAKHIAQSEPDTIQILYGSDYKGVWYIPGEYSYPTAMLRDAGVRYDYVAGKTESTPVNYEYVFSRHRHAKIWLSVMMSIKEPTRASFLAQNERYATFDAAKHGDIWLDRKRVNAHGGNDYWESAPYRPDLILKDIIKITRPHLLPSYETTYFIKLK